MFTEKELAESIQELADLESELQKLDGMYNDAVQQLPADLASTKLSREGSQKVEELISEAKRRAEEEGRNRAAQYRDSHVMLEEPKTFAKGRRGGLII